MQLVRAAALHRFEKQRLARKFTAGDELIHAGDVHSHDAAGADVQVAHFAIAHLSFGQTDEGAGGVNQSVGKFLEQAVVVWFTREGNGVAFGVRAIAPAVEDGEDDGSWSLSHGCSASCYRVSSIPSSQITLARGRAVARVMLV